MVMVFKTLSYVEDFSFHFKKVVNILTEIKANSLDRYLIVVSTWWHYWYFQLEHVPPILQLQGTSLSNEKSWIHP